jgi:hypothetical protein
MQALRERSESLLLGLSDPLTLQITTITCLTPPPQLLCKRLCYFRVGDLRSLPTATEDFRCSLNCQLSESYTNRIQRTRENDGIKVVL